MLTGCVPWPEKISDSYAAKGYWNNIPLGEAFDRAAEVFTDREALVYGDERISFNQLKSGSDRIARYFLKLGLKPLDRVIVQLPNIPEFVYCYLAFLKIGVIPVMCLPPHRFTEIAHIAEKCEAKGYVIPDYYHKHNYLKLAGEVSKAVPSVKNIFVVGRECREGQFLINQFFNDKTLCANNGLEKYRPDPMEVAVFLLSGGTTGLPKIIPRTHNDYLYTARMTGLPVGLNMYSVYLAIAPLAHNMTLACPGLKGTLFNGGKVVLTATTDVENLCKLIEKEKISILPLVPALIITLLNYKERKNYDLSSLKIIISGGSKLNPEVAKRIKPELDCNLIQQFGMAEGLLTMTNMNDPEEVVFNTVGRPVSPADEIKIVDDDEAEVTPGETGELLCRGPYTIRGYYQAADHNGKAFTTDGYYKTGDLVKLEPVSGCLIIEGRKKDLINRGGEKISAEEVENLILAHPKVDNAAVVAMPDPLLGERSCAYVTLKNNETLTLTELNMFMLEKKIAKFKLPERLEIIDQFPLTNVGKIQKKELRLDIEKKIEEEIQANEQLQA